MRTLNVLGNDQVRSKVEYFPSAMLSHGLMQKSDVAVSVDSSVVRAHNPILLILKTTVARRAPKK